MKKTFSLFLTFNFLLCFVLFFELRAYSQVEPNYALGFNGVSNSKWVKVSHNPTFVPTDFITLEAWINPAAVSSAGSVIASKHKNIGNREWDFSIQSTNYLRFSLYRTNDDVSNPVILYSNSLISTNTWTHVACTYSYTTGIAKIYLNGILDKSSNVGAFNINSSNMPVLIGAYWYDEINNITRGNFNGTIDEVRIWNVERTQTQIQASMCHHLIGNENGLIAYYPMDEGAGTFTEDKSINSNNGTLVNNPIWVGGIIPSVYAGIDKTICSGETANLLATGGANYTWNSGAISASLIVSPVVNSTYTVSVSNNFGCIATDEVIVNVIPTEITNQIVSINLGESYFVGGANQTVSGTYYDTLTNRFGCDSLIITELIVSSSNTNADFAIQFDGLNNSKCIKVLDDSTFIPTDFITLEAWINPAAVSSDGSVIASKHKNIGNREWDFSIQSTNYLRFSLYRTNDDVSNPVILYSNSLISTNTWTHVACTYSFSTGIAKIYLNGILDKSSNVGAFNINSSNMPVLIGAYWYDEINNITRGNFNGILDEVRIWNVERTQTQIQASMCQRLIGNENGLVAYYPFDEGSGTFTEDKSLNANNGTLVNGPVWVNGTLSYADEDMYICAGASTNIAAYGGVSYTWNNGANSSSISVSPIVNTTYSVSITSAMGCLAVNNVVVNVNPHYSINQNIIINYNQTYFCGGAYQNQSGTYSDSLITQHGCDSIITTNLLVYQPPLTISDYALQFNGVQNGKWVKINDHPSLDPTNDITLEAFIKPSNYPSDFAFISSKSRNIGEREWDFIFLANGKIRFSLFRSNDLYTNPVLIYSNATVALNNWSHISCTYSQTSGIAKIYINGVLDKSENVGVINFAATQVPVLIGAYWDDYLNNITRSNFNGIIDEVRIWNVERSQTQIQASMCQRLIGNENGLVAYYPFDEGSGTFTEDKSLNANNGTLVNGPVWVNGSQPYADEDKYICAGASTNIAAYGGVSYTWNNGANTSSISVSPIVNTTYSVSITSAMGCLSVNDVVVNINPNPQPQIYGDLVYCASNFTTLNTNSYPSILWSTGSNAQNVQVNSSNNPITVTVTDTNGCVGTSNPVNVNQGGAGSLNGTVMYSGGYIGNGDGNAHLFKAGPNGHHQLQASSPIGNNGSFSFTNIPAGAYYLCVKLVNHSNYQHVHDSYYDSTFKWQEAHILNIGCAYDSTIIMHMFETGPQAVGTGNISGVTRYVTPSTSGSSKNYTPVVGANIYLLNDLNNQLISYTATIEDGSYKVCEIPNGNYTMYVDLPGFSMIETYSNITLNSANNLFSGFDFYVDTTYATAGIYIDEATKTKTFESEQFALNVFPNPATDILNIDFANQKVGKVVLALTDIYGRQTVLSHKYNEKIGVCRQSFKIQNYKLSSGIYLLQLITDYQTLTKRIIIE